MKFKIALAQFYPRLGDLNWNLELFREKIQEAIRGKAQLIIFPELGLTGYFLRDMVSGVALKRDSRLFNEVLKLSTKISICFGFVEETDSVEFYNSGAYLEGGKIVHVHQKVYLPTYGMFDEQRYFSRGKSIRSFQTRFGKMGMLICEDLWHPSSIQVLALDGVKFILALSSSPGRGVSEDGKLGSTKLWEEMNRFYARLYGLYCIYVNRAGVEEGINFWGGSEVIDPEGQTLVKAPYFKEDLVFAQLDEGQIRRSRVKSPLIRDENLDLVIYELSRIRKESAGDSSEARRGNARAVSKRRNSKSRI